MLRFDTRIRVGILGATGLVGQRLLVALDSHPWFEAVRLGASERSEGKRYADAVRWALPGDVPDAAAGLEVAPCDPGEFRNCDVVLSSLDGAVAGDLESRFVEAGLRVVSNSSAHRMARDVPLVIPEINADHLEIVRARAEDGAGFLVTNPNCSVVGLALVLAPLHRAFGVRRVLVSTLQALSGAGMDGPSALAMIDNVVPFISGEEDKIEREFRKLLGTRSASGDGVEEADIPVSAHCHRVGSIDGHLEAVSVEFDRPADPADAVEALRDFLGDVRSMELPSAPDRPIVVRDEPDRPQPRLDRDTGGGMTAVVGRVRRCPVLSLRLELLSHNTIRGAAGAALLNAELLAARGWLDPRPAR